MARGDPKLVVQFNDIGVPLQNRAKLASKVGALARSVVDINVRDWRREDLHPGLTEIKRRIWEDCLVVFDY